MVREQFSPSILPNKTVGPHQTIRRMHQANPRNQTSDRWHPVSNAVLRDPMMAAIPVRIASPALSFRDQYEICAV